MIDRFDTIFALCTLAGREYRVGNEHTSEIREAGGGAYNVYFNNGKHDLVAHVPAHAVEMVVWGMASDGGWA
jgi:hypothetical protein